MQLLGTALSNLKKIDSLPVLYITLSQEELNQNNFKINNVIYKIINTYNPKIKYISGSFLERFGIVLKFILPQKLFEYLVLKLF